MRSTVAVIDLDALVWNLSVVRRRAPGKAVLGMVKANAYGHGMLPVAKALQGAGIDLLGVALVDEAVQLRKAGITVPIMVLTPAEPADCAAVVEHGLVTVACDLSQVQVLSATALAAGRVADVHLYVDTGMHRDGFRPPDAVAAAVAVQALPGIRLVGICTHFATADDPASPFLREQLSTFTDVVAQCTAAGCSFVSVHAANTGALWQSDATHFTMVRPGLSLYGYAPPAADEMTLRPVMQIRSSVVSVRRAWPGETVSYGRRYVVPHETTIVTVPIGYGDGYMRSLTGRASCLIGGRRHPVVGTICMDEIMVDVGDTPVALGDEVVLLGYQAHADGRLESIDAIELAEWAGTIPYEITTAVSARVPRMFTGKIDV